MQKKAKAAFIGGAAVLFIGAGVLVYVNIPKGEEGTKHFTVTVSSERDNINRTLSCTSDCEFFGQWCREQDFITYSDSEYGIYITAVDGCGEDIDEQYWWCVTENGEAASVGADSLPLTDGNSYGLELRHGW